VPHPQRPNSVSRKQAASQAQPLGFSTSLGKKGFSIPLICQDIALGTVLLNQEPLWKVQAKLFEFVEWLQENFPI
jgi:hypothetical protein